MDGVPLFGSLNLLIIIWYIVKVYIYIRIQKESVQNKSLMGFKFWRSCFDGWVPFDSLILYYDLTLNP